MFRMSTLKRQIGLPGAVLLGLGSIVGTGVYVAIAFAADVAGPAVLVAVVLAAGLALCNGLSSAQLAAAHPVAGGTYAYGYRYLNPSLGFAAGTLFLAAKSASAATAALGFAYYYEHLTGATQTRLIALLALAGITSLVLKGIRRSNAANTVLIAVAIGALLIYTLQQAPAMRLHRATPLLPHRPWPLLEATALMFVAYTGYGRVATLGEEVHNPKRTIPRAVIATLAVSAALYLLIAFVLTTSRTAPLEAGLIPAIGAMVAMLGVLLNLVLGLSRVVLAMAREGDMPKPFARVDDAGVTPGPAVWLVAVIVAGLILVGDLKLAWSFSAFTVLLYYSLTNACALAQPTDQRRFPRWVHWVGLAGCVSLAWWVDGRALLTGLAVLAVSFAARAVFRRAQPA